MYLHVMTISENRSHDFEGEQGGVQKRAGREQRRKDMQLCNLQT